MHGVQLSAGSMAILHRQHSAAFHFCNVLGEAFVFPIAVPHRHNQAGCGSQLPDVGVMLGSPSPRAHPTWTAHASEGHFQVPAYWRDTFFRTKCRLEANQEKILEKSPVNPDAQVVVAEPMRWVQSCIPLCPLCQRCSFSPCPHTPSTGQGIRGAPWVPELLFLVPKRGGGVYPRDALLSCPGLPPQGRRRQWCWQGMVCWMRPHTVQAQGGWQTDARQAARVEAPIILALGSLEAVAIFRVTRRLARSPMALHIPFLSLNEWSNLAGGHCKAQ